MKDLDGILKKTIDSLRTVSESEAVVGRPVTAEDGTVLIPVSKVSCGFAAGGGEYSLKGDGHPDHPCAAAGGGGLTVTPIGFLVCGREKKFIALAPPEKEEKWKELLRSALKAVKGDGDEK